MLHSPATSFGQAVVLYVTLGILQGTEILKWNFFGSGHGYPESYLFPIKDLIY